MESTIDTIDTPVTVGLPDRVETWDDEVARDVAFAVALGLWRGAGTAEDLLHLVPVLARDVISRSGYDADAEAEAADIAERARTLLSVGLAGYGVRYGGYAAWADRHDRLRAIATAAGHNALPSYLYSFRAWTDEPTIIAFGPEANGGSASCIDCPTCA